MKNTLYKIKAYCLIALLLAGCIEEPEPQETFSNVNKIELAEPAVRFKEFEGVWQVSANGVVRVPTYPQTTARYCEGNQAYNGTFDWETRTATFLITINSCNNNLRLVFYRDQEEIVANYVLTRWGNCSNAGTNIWIKPNRSTRSC